jgi:hypothetical protein
MATKQRTPLSLQPRGPKRLLLQLKQPRWSQNWTRYYTKGGCRSLPVVSGRWLLKECVVKQPCCLDGQSANVCANACMCARLRLS